MGFSVGYSKGLRAEVADRLIARPQSLFGKPYAGYLFFLFENVTAADKGHEVLEWLDESKGRLDALTGEHVAYAVFTLRFGVDANKLHNGNGVDVSLPTAGSGDNRRVVTATIDNGDVEFRRLVTAGAWGWLKESCRLEGMNKAVRDLADRWGVPVKDALPGVIV